MFCMLTVMVEKETTSSLNRTSIKWQAARHEDRDVTARVADCQTEDQWGFNTSPVARCWQAVLPTSAFDHRLEQDAHVAERYAPRRRGRRESGVGENVSRQMRGCPSRTGGQAAPPAELCPARGATPKDAFRPTKSVVSFQERDSSGVKSQRCWCSRSSQARTQCASARSGHRITGASAPGEEADLRAR